MNLIQRTLIGTAIAGMTGMPVWAQAPADAPQAFSGGRYDVRGLSRVGFLGIGIQEVTSDRVKALKLKEEAGVEITRVGPESPAEKGGLKVGDVILQYNGTRVDGIEQFSRLVRETPPGRDAKMEVFRNGVSQTLMVKIGQHPAVKGLPEGLGFNMPDVPRIIQGMKSPMLGVEAEPVDGQLAQYFGVKEGVLVRSVGSGSPAEKAGIKAGDIILRVDDSKVTNPGEIMARLRAGSGKTVQVGLMRDKKEMNVSVTLDQPSSPTGKAGRVQLLNPDE